MKKEFKENEEISEKNLDMQDEIDDETFQRLLEEEFIEREKQIEEALFADKDFEDLVLTKEEVKASYEELMRRFEREKSAEISEEPLLDEKPAHEVALEGKSDLHEGKSQEQNLAQTWKGCGYVDSCCGLCICCEYDKRGKQELSRQQCQDPERG